MPRSLCPKIQIRRQKRRRRAVRKPVSIRPRKPATYRTKNAREGDERSFFITWSVLTLSPVAHPTADTAGRAAHPERFLLAVATEDTVPVVDVHSVATPLDVKRLLEPPAAAY